MNSQVESNNKNILLALHSTTEYFGVAVVECGDYKLKNLRQKTFFTGRKLSNDLFSNINSVLPLKTWKNIKRIAVATGPGGFTGTRITISMSRIIAQQLSVSLDGISSFQLIAKRLFREQNNIEYDEPFWIISKLNRRGIIGGKYKVNNSYNLPYYQQVHEIKAPHLLKDSLIPKNSFEAKYEIDLDTIELSKISHSYQSENIFNSWEKVLPIYPISPVS